MQHGIPHYTAHDLTQAARKKHCCIVVTLNEGDRIQRQLKNMKDYSAIVDIVIADGESSDGSLGLDFLKSNNIKALLTTKETGLATALRMGLHYALNNGYQGVITLDGNAKDGVEAIPVFANALDQGFDLVQGSRFMPGGSHKHTPLERYLGIRWIVAPILSLSGFYYTDPTNGFRAISMNFLKDPRVQPLRAVFKRFNIQHYFNYRAAKLNFKIKEIPVQRSYPADSVPTKIHKTRTKLLFLYELLATVAGRYNP